MITKRFLLNEILFLESMWNTLILKKHKTDFFENCLWQTSQKKVMVNYN